MLKETNKTGQVEEDSLTYYNIRQKEFYTREKKSCYFKWLHRERTVEQHSTGGTLALLIQNAIPL
jgi:hypothetical protein